MTRIEFYSSTQPTELGEYPKGFGTLLMSGHPPTASASLLAPTFYFASGSTQRPSDLIRLINSATPCSSGTFLISSRPRYKDI